MPDKPDIWYSAKVVQYANYDPWAEWEQPSGSHPGIVYDMWEVTQYTPKGVRLRHVGDGVNVKGDLLLGLTMNAFAAPTKCLALQDALARSRKNEKMLALRQADAMADTAYLQKLMKKEECGNAFDF